MPRKSRTIKLRVTRRMSPAELRKHEEKLAQRQEKRVPSAAWTQQEQEWTKRCENAREEGRREGYRAGQKNILTRVELNAVACTRAADTIPQGIRGLVPERRIRLKMAATLYVLAGLIRHQLGEEDPETPEYEVGMMAPSKNEEPGATKF